MVDFGYHLPGDGLEAVSGGSGRQTGQRCGLVNSWIAAAEAGDIGEIFGEGVLPYAVRNRIVEPRASMHPPPT